jgi:iron complex outermembrane receptor protein
LERATAPAPSEDDGAISEVLVIGRRTQNADIRRTENDIQPYNVIGPRELSVAPQDNLDQYFRDRLPSNSQLVSPSQNVGGGAASNSAIDLRGVGTQRTLVLVDGRRLPSLPTTNDGWEQADLNPIPMGAIDRIETLTGAAGGIHGPTAVGGVINVVLKRDYRGAGLTAVSGISSRGDAGRARLEGRIGFTPDGGRTDVMLSASYQAARPLERGDRDYALRSLQLEADSAPARYATIARPVNAVLAYALGGEPLRLDAALGGTTLSSSHTFLPVDLNGPSQALLGALIGNSDKLAIDPPQGSAGSDTSLVSTPKSYSALLNVRHRFSDRVEGFVDAVHLGNRARAVTPAVTQAFILGADVASNPFSNALIVIYPMPDFAVARETKIDTDRLTGGLIITLPRRWQASADYTIGRATVESHTRSLGIGPGFSNGGVAGPNGKPAVMPFGGYAALQTALRAYAVETSSDQRLVNDFRDAAVRAAGPLASLPAGPLTLTLVAEERREHMPQVTRLETTTNNSSVIQTFDRTQVIRSGYVELRAPLVSRESRFIPLRGLEAQLALRRDDVRTTFPENAIAGSALAIPLTTIRHQADVFTVGARALPVSWLMLRASLATGQAPPNLRYLKQTVISASSRLTDPKRAGRILVSEGPVSEVRSGSHLIEPEKGRTLSVGVVVNPSGVRGPRVSADYSRIEIRDEILPFASPNGNLIDFEALFPERIVREPLSAADAALGFTGGRVTTVYTGFGNEGRTTTESVDFQLDWSLPPIPYGEARLYGAATWTPALRSKLKRFGPWIDRSGYRDAPLDWRGNGGVEWKSGPLTLDLNLQYFAGYKTAWSPSYTVQGDIAVDQGASRVRSQAYVDLVARRQFVPRASLPVQALDVRLAVQNVFDSSPPTVVDFAHPGYDYRGDPRRRRLEILLSAKF